MKAGTRQFVLGMLLALASNCFALDYSGRVVGVLDGDTVELLTSNHERIRVRLSGIDAPEKRQAFGHAAKRALSNLVFEKAVVISGEKQDRYGRLVEKSSSPASMQTYAWSEAVSPGTTRSTSARSPLMTSSLTVRPKRLLARKSSDCGGTTSRLLLGTSALRRGHHSARERGRLATRQALNAAAPTACAGRAARWPRSHRAAGGPRSQVPRGSRARRPAANRPSSRCGCRPGPCALALVLTAEPESASSPSSGPCSAWSPSQSDSVHCMARSPWSWERSFADRCHTPRLEP